MHGDDAVFEIREVYYDDDDNVVGMTADAIGPYGESILELQDDLNKLADAFNRPVIDITEELYEVNDL